MKPQRLLAARYLRAKHAYGFISFIGYLGMIGLALGVAALILTWSVIRGFETAVQQKVAALDGDLRLVKVLDTPGPLPKDLLIRWRPTLLSRRWCR